MRDLMTLKKACDSAVSNPDFKSQIINGSLVTKCNIASRFIAQAMGCHEFDNENLMADDMYSIMSDNKSLKWNKIFGAAASLWAQESGLAIGCKTSISMNAHHGHIVVIYPAPMQMSGSLGKPVPMCADIGKADQNAIEKVSQAFPVAFGEPDYFQWLG